MSIDFLNSTVFEFEKQVDDRKIWEYSKENPSTYVLCCVLYVIGSFSGKKIMESKERFGLSPVLAVWSLSLAIFSILGTYRVWIEILEVLLYEGFHSSVCNSGWAVHPISRVWASLFLLSKVVELGDTVFIVLRKQQLIFLHWYHHITVLMYCVVSYADHTSVSRWFMGINVIVHAFMYSYYALRAMKFRVPNQIRMAITLMQLGQMMFGCSLTFYIYYVKKQGQPCQTSDTNVYISFTMYFSYFILFAKFFYDSYVKPAPRTPNVKPVASELNNNKPVKLD